MDICYYVVRDGVMIQGEKRMMGETVPSLSLDHRSTERLVRRGWVNPVLVRSLPEDEQRLFIEWMATYETKVEESRVAVEEAIEQVVREEDTFEAELYEDEEEELVPIDTLTVLELDSEFGDVKGYPHGSKKREKLDFLESLGD